ncbi:hypothetical protein GGTG_06859 [Gaeumannomyces tritici R3-111a-1]|uniref:Uncharacterized protein n=1 Tax=Gaeumannomyces tritici (strain R3-111a-1) TaxID=644352 RepID=J3P012_GAET3|nr:hypothetical protein GGTG_06859 [Gaeumannomyces tritici R3-111a-1]EJT76945.1 hypothetical protein GGTG_06859 [Gaeumannomyces tritici R3-111a-1]
MMAGAVGDANLALPYELGLRWKALLDPGGSRMKTAVLASLDGSAGSVRGGLGGKADHRSEALRSLRQGGQGTEKAFQSSKDISVIIQAVHSNHSGSSKHLPIGATPRDTLSRASSLLLPSLSILGYIAFVRHAIPKHRLFTQSLDYYYYGSHSAAGVRSIHHLGESGARIPGRQEAPIHPVPGAATSEPPMRLLHQMLQPSLQQI